MSTYLLVWIQIHLNLYNNKHTNFLIRFYIKAVCSLIVLYIYIYIIMWCICILAIKFVDNVENKKVVKWINLNVTNKYKQSIHSKSVKATSYLLKRKQNLSYKMNDYIITL